MGGAGSAVGEVLAAHGVLVPLLQLGIPDRFIEHGSRDTCLAAAGLDLAGISASVEDWWSVENPERVTIGQKRLRAHRAAACEPLAGRRKYMMNSQRAAP